MLVIVDETMRPNQLSMATAAKPRDAPPIRASRRDPSVGHEIAAAPRSAAANIRIRRRSESAGARARRARSVMVVVARAVDVAVLQLVLCRVAHLDHLDVEV